MSFLFFTCVGLHITFPGLTLLFLLSTPLSFPDASICSSRKSKFPVLSVKKVLLVPLVLHTYWLVFDASSWDSWFSIWGRSRPVTPFESGGDKLYWSFLCCHHANRSRLQHVLNVKHKRELLIDAGLQIPVFLCHKAGLINLILHIQILSWTA